MEILKLGDLEEEIETKLEGKSALEILEIINGFLFTDQDHKQVAEVNSLIGGYIKKNPKAEEKHYGLLLEHVTGALRTCVLGTEEEKNSFPFSDKVVDYSFPLKEYLRNRIKSIE